MLSRHMSAAYWRQSRRHSAGLTNQFHLNQFEGTHLCRHYHWEGLA